MCACVSASRSAFVDNICRCIVMLILAGVSQAGVWAGLQLQGHGDMQRFNSSSPAIYSPLFA